MFRKGHSENETTISLLASQRNNKLPPEIEEGNIEYKLKLVNPPPERIDHLITQLKWRLAEGGGEAMYEIGVSDSGNLVGLDPNDMKSSLDTLKTMASKLCAELSIVRTQKVTGNRTVTEVMFRKCLEDDQHFLEIRVAILGAADAGKSTFLSVLCYNEKDNGRGKAALNLLRHRHEIETGRSSSLSRQIIGFGPSGDVINYASTNIRTWEQICENATKIVTFLDTPGYPKYQKTTIGGLTGNAPDYACLILNANFGGLPEVSREHILLTKLLKVPLIVIITKIDIASNDQLTRTLKALVLLLKSPGVSRMPTVIQSKDDISTSIPLLMEGKIVPLMLISNVTGDNFENLRYMFNLLPKPPALTDQLEADSEFQIEDVFTVEGTGCVVGGLMTTGRIYLNGNPQLFLLGPDQGEYTPVVINSIQRQRCQIKHLQAGQAGTCAIKFIPQTKSPNYPVSITAEDLSQCADKPPVDFRIRRGQVLIPICPSPKSYWEVEVELYILSHPSMLAAGHQMVLHSGSVRQLVRVVAVKDDNNSSNPPSPVISPASSNSVPDVFQNVDMSLAIKSTDLVTKSKKRKQRTVSGNYLTIGQHGRVTVKFIHEPERITIGSTVLLRGTNIKCVGKVLATMSCNYNDTYR
ncbi:P-loop containing nucleoside triphosphate hydrolase protein [Globomyces pollinis-pini]|nr:P-loop containing nucleoside triphosphate hydrolase protein [Globomyces pollinis-pini]